MSERVVVLGAGYAGTTAVKRLEQELSDAELTWVSREEYHLVLHEVHRAIRDPSVADRITIPIEDVAAPSTGFVHAEVVDVDTAARRIDLDDGRELEYDYLLVALGSRTAFYGIPGMGEHALTLKGLDDAETIHRAVAEAAREATPEEPAQVAIGGAGLSGIQSAGEVATYRDEEGAPIEITLIEALDEILPGQDPDLQRAVRKKVEAAGIEILTGDPIVEATAETVHFDEGDPLDYDVLVWAGGVTGQDALGGADLSKNHNRVETDATFQSTDERVFAVGDTAIIEQGDGEVAPPTAQAAWQAAEVAADNLVRTMNGQPLDTWTYEDKGTLVSVGEEAVAHDVVGVPIETFNAYPAKFLKKMVAARWIADVSSWRRALRAWDVL